MELAGHALPSALKGLQWRRRGRIGDDEGVGTLSTHPEWPRYTADNALYTYKFKCITDPGKSDSNCYFNQRKPLANQSVAPIIYGLHFKAFPRTPGRCPCNMTPDMTLDFRSVRFDAPPRYTALVRIRSHIRSSSWAGLCAMAITIAPVPDKGHIDKAFP